MFVSFKFFYFSLFFITFSPSQIFKYAGITLNILFKNWLVTLLLVILFIIVIYANTIVHPYLLADNRHYIFYIWNRFYGRYTMFKYIMVRSINEYVYLVLTTD